MICSSSSSGRSRRGAAVLALLLLSACRHVREAPPPLKLAAFPVQNASGGAAPIRQVTEDLEAALAAEGVQLLPRNDLDLAMARHRIRYTGGVDRVMAKVLRDELGVDAMLVPTLELYGADKPPSVSLSARIISTGDRPEVLWADSVSRAGDDAPGILGLGLVDNVAQLEKTVAKSVARSVKRYVTTGQQPELCGEAGRFQPHRAFRAPVLDDVGRRTIAVLPFTNETTRRSAGDILVGEFVAQLARSRSFEVVDPGMVREELLAHHIVLEGGVSVDHAMALLSELQADLVLSGYVTVYEARSGRRGPPKIEFSAYVLDKRTGELVWSSTSNGEGDEGVWFFGAGRVHTSTALSCRMVRGVVDGIVGKRGRLSRSE